MAGNDSGAGKAKLHRLFREQQRIVLAIEQTHAEGAAAEQAIREQREMVSTDLRSLAAFRLALEEKRQSLTQRKGNRLRSSRSSARLSWRRRGGFSSCRS